MIKLPIIKKAWFVANVDGLSDWEINWEVVYAETPGKAKSVFLKHEEGEYLFLSVKRGKLNDVVLFEDKETKRHCVLTTLETRKRIQERKEKVLKFPENEEFYIQNGYVGNSVYWWRLGNAGYTTNLNEAQKYTREEILTRLNMKEGNKIWPASHVLEHISPQVDSQHLNYNLVL